MECVVWEKNGQFKVSLKEALEAASHDHSMVWIDFSPGDDGSMQVIHELGFDDLTVRRWADKDCRAHAENYEKYVYVLLHRLRYGTEKGVAPTGYHCYLGRNYLVTVHNGKRGLVHEAMSAASSERIFHMGPDMLFYYLSAELVECCFPILDEVAEKVGSLEEEMYSDPSKETPRRLYDMKRDLLDLRRFVAPMREAFGYLARKENQVIDADVLPFIWDLYDRAVRVSELVDLNREIVSGALEMYMTIVSNRMNEKITALTVVSTVFLPLTVIVGYYGMNFRHFPELKWPLGIGFVWVIMIGVSIAMVRLFRRHHWM